MAKDEQGKDEQPKALAVIKDYAVMQMQAQELGEIVRENLGGQQIDIFQLDRVKVPGSGGLSWEIPDLLAEGGSVTSKTLEGVILYFSDGNGYWDKPYDGSNTPPVCSSEDGLVGISDNPDLGGDCLTCPLNAFGTNVRDDGTKGKGKACKNMRRLFIVRKGLILPLLLVVPPTSLKAVRQFFLRLAGAGVPYYGVTSKLTLTPDKSEKGIPYSKITIGLGARLSPEEAAHIKAFKEAITPALKRIKIIDVTQEEAQGE